jgi:hypothetical protein
VFVKYPKLKVIGFLLNPHCFLSITAHRLYELKQAGFALRKFIIINIPRWRGPYYFCMFERASEKLNIQFFSVRNDD